jgi:hypothetical protein
MQHDPIRLRNVKKIKGKKKKKIVAQLLPWSSGRFLYAGVSWSHTLRYICLVYIYTYTFFFIIIHLYIFFANQSSSLLFWSRVQNTVFFIFFFLFSFFSKFLPLLFALYSYLKFRFSVSGFIFLKMRSSFPGRQRPVFVAGHWTQQIDGKPSLSSNQLQ